MHRKTSVVVWFCVFAYAITWVAVSPLVARGLGLYEGAFPAWWHALGAVGPVAAAFLAARIGGGARLQRWLAGVTRWRISGGWWAVAVGSPIALLTAAVLVAWTVTGDWPGGTLSSGAGTDPALWAGLLVVSLAYGLGEEPGWRGFLLPTLMERHTPRVATFFVAAIWAAWHAPFFAYRFDFDGPGTVVGFFIAMLAGAYWLSFLYIRTGGSVPAVAAWHVMWDVVNLVGAEMSSLVVAMLNALMMVLGFAVVFLRGPWTAGRSEIRPPATG
ncbi:MAG: CPBP family intramembrane metalloprotease [Gemmatimonadota bacterium]|jgi:membrane protease YdiL (CAAX protease family)